MGHTYSSNLLHCVFSTKERRRSITPEMKTRLEPYLAGIARENGFKALAIGAVADHVHLLLSLPATMCPSKALQLLKGGSSKWIHDTFSGGLRIRLARRVWRLQHWDLGRAGNQNVHSEPGGTSSKAGFCGGIPGHVEEARPRV